MQLRQLSTHTCTPSPPRLRPRPRPPRPPHPPCPRPRPRSVYFQNPDPYPNTRLQLLRRSLSRKGASLQMTLFGYPPIPTPTSYPPTYYICIPVSDCPAGWLPNRRGGAAPAPSATAEGEQEKRKQEEVVCLPVPGPTLTLTLTLTLPKVVYPPKGYGLLWTVT